MSLLAAVLTAVNDPDPFVQAAKYGVIIVGVLCIVGVVVVLSCLFWAALLFALFGSRRRAAVSVAAIAASIYFGFAWDALVWVDSVWKANTTAGYVFPVVFLFLCAGPFGVYFAFVWDPTSPSDHHTSLLAAERLRRHDERQARLNGDAF